MDGLEVRQVMLASYDLGYINGDYAFLAFNTRISGGISHDERWKQQTHDLAGNLNDKFITRLCMTLYIYK